MASTLRKYILVSKKYYCNRLKKLQIVITTFLIEEKDRNSRVFEKTFLLANIYIDITYEILFLNLSNIKMDFNNCKFI